MIDVSIFEHNCTHNYDENSGGMESDSLLLVLKNLKEKYNGVIYLADSNMKLKKIVAHAQYKPKG